MAKERLTPQTVEIANPGGDGGYLFVCEHAGNHIPAKFKGLGLDANARASHIAYDPGAYEVAGFLAKRLNSTLVAQKISRLIYDCNRPPSVASAIPEQSEIYTIPGNLGLSEQDRDERVRSYYQPFRETINRLLERQNPILVTIHSFTPVFHGQRRTLDIGVLHDDDARLADALLQSMTNDKNGMAIRLNEPYSAKDGVTHTLKQHAISRGLLNVMLEIRNDLIQTPEHQREMANWLADHLEKVRSILLTTSMGGADA